MPWLTVGRFEWNHAIGHLYHVEKTGGVPEMPQADVLVYQETVDGPLPGTPLRFWRCGCAHRDYADYRTREGETESMKRWRETNRL